MMSLTKSWAIVSSVSVAAAAGVAIVATQFIGLHAIQNNPLTNAITGVFSPAPAPAQPVKTAAIPPVPAPGTAAPKAAAPAEKPVVPQFDVVRVEPDGSTVVAGVAAPNAAVALLASGTVIGEAKTDASGHFAIVPQALAPGGTTLTLRQDAGPNAVDSTQSVSVSVPAKGQDKSGLVVALAEPGRAIKLLVAPGPVPPGPVPTGPVATPPGSALPAQTKAAAAKPAAPGALPALAFRSVELENGNGFFASGTAPPGTKLGIYLNNSHLADVVAGADSGWSVKIQQGLAPGHYTVRADAVVAAKPVPGAASPAKQTRSRPEQAQAVTARAEVPFDVPAANATAASGPSATLKVVAAPPGLARPAGAGPADAVVPEVKTTIVRTGDNLWDISKVQLGSGFRYTRIYAANAAQIRNPDVIYPGQVFVVPPEKIESNN